MQTAEEYLAHHGVKGQKWGVRRDRGHEGEQVKTKQLGKLDKQWERQNTGVSGFIKVHNAVADRMNNGEIDRFNNEPRWKAAADAGHLNDDNHPETHAYFKAYEDLSNKMMAEEGAKLGSNPSGTKKYEIRHDEEGTPYAYLAPVDRHAQHAVSKETVLKIVRKANGTVDKLVVGEVAMSHVDDFVNSLFHHGIKGMKWGVRKEVRNSPDVTVVGPKKSGGYVKTTGGKGLPAHEDAVRAATSRQKAHSSTTDSLSNKELQDLVNRMNLESQYTRLNFDSDRRSAGHKFVAGLFGQGRYGSDKRKFTDQFEEAGKAVSEVLKKEQAKKA